MKGFIYHVALGSCLGGALALLAGCVPGYYECVDPCWPERYNYQARKSIRDTYNAQAANGHALEQTIWNQHFEPGTDKLAKFGEEHLRYLARRKPVPDPKIYLQTAHDAKGNPANLEELKTARAKLDEDRTKAIKSYFKYLTNLEVDVLVADFGEPGIRSRGVREIYISPSEAAYERKLQQDQTARSASARTVQTVETKETITQKNN
ncbi:MAG: hypothetical protein NZO58_11215 [Gemmataceae bacterium]|nr:hypothetical protein [Gemmataceae bacterium]